jgi:hypothetical protein
MIDQAGGLRRQASAVRAAANRAAAGMAGTGADEALLGIVLPLAGEVEGLAQRLADAGTAVFDYGAKVQETKIIFFVTLAFLAYQVATLVSLAVETGGAALAGIAPLITSAELSLRQVVQDAVLAVLKGAVVGAVVMGGGDALIQGLQLATGGRKQMDWSSVEAGLVGGAVFGGVFEFLKGVGDVLPQVLGKGPVLGPGITLPGTELSVVVGDSLPGKVVMGGVSGLAGTGAGAKAVNPHAPVTDLGSAFTSGALLGGLMPGREISPAEPAAPVTADITRLPRELAGGSGFSEPPTGRGSVGSASADRGSVASGGLPEVATRDAGTGTAEPAAAPFATDTGPAAGSSPATDTGPVGGARPTTETGAAAAAVRRAPTEVTATGTPVASTAGTVAGTGPDRAVNPVATGGVTSAGGADPASTNPTTTSTARGADQAVDTPATGAASAATGDPAAATAADPAGQVSTRSAPAGADRVTATGPAGGGRHESPAGAAQPAPAAGASGTRPPAEAHPPTMTGDAVPPAAAGRAETLTQVSTAEARTVGGDGGTGDRPVMTAEPEQPGPASWRGESAAPDMVADPASVAGTARPGSGDRAPVDRGVEIGQPAGPVTTRAETTRTAGAELTDPPRTGAPGADTTPRQGPHSDLPPDYPTALTDPPAYSQKPPPAGYGSAVPGADDIPTLKPAAGPGTQPAGTDWLAKHGIDPHALDHDLQVYRVDAAADGVPHPGGPAPADPHPQQPPRPFHAAPLDAPSAESERTYADYATDNEARHLLGVPEHLLKAFWNSEHPVGSVIGPDGFTQHGFTEDFRYRGWFAPDAEGVLRDPQGRDAFGNEAPTTTSDDLGDPLSRLGVTPARAESSRPAAAPTDDEFRDTLSRLGVTPARTESSRPATFGQPRPDASPTTPTAVGPNDAVAGTLRPVNSYPRAWSELLPEIHATAARDYQAISAESRLTLGDERMSRLWPGFLGEVHMLLQRSHHSGGLSEDFAPGYRDLLRQLTTDEGRQTLIGEPDNREVIPRSGHYGYGEDGRIRWPDEEQPGEYGERGRFRAVYDEMREEALRLHKRTGDGKVLIQRQLGRMFPKPPHVSTVGRWLREEKESADRAAESSQPEQRQPDHPQPWADPNPYFANPITEKTWNPWEEPPPIQSTETGRMGFDPRSGQPVLIPLSENINPLDYDPVQGWGPDPSAGGGQGPSAPEDWQYDEVRQQWFRG